MGSATSSNDWHFGFVRIGIADGCGLSGSGFVYNVVRAFTFKSTCS